MLEPWKEAECSQSWTGWLGEEQQPLKWQHMEGAPLSPTLRQARVDTDANPVEDGREHLQQRQSQEADRGGQDLAYQEVLRT